ncbi:PE38 [Maruca vitrata nucleopolyhedrovirus]|uniref:PE38 n=1 Tax=Maruca vitrata nucleopolyhedrovirus TaxID=1307954 RepID=A1YRI3_9ABAC|nr:PE38 [Maruca vitrata nucleopolyhedrovirus]ABM05437.1 PE38 [Maruca vitrata nucleopolyhedrovirus]
MSNVQDSLASNQNIQESNNVQDSLASNQNITLRSSDLDPPMNFIDNYNSSDTIDSIDIDTETDNYSRVRRRRRNLLQALKRKQEKMLAEFNNEPVINLKFECCVCFETYYQQSNETCPFLIPTSCNHGFCFKCVIDLQSNAINIPYSTICCPLCNVQIKMWRSCKPETVVTCKFYKKTQEKVPPVQQYKNIMKVLQERNVINIDDGNNSGDDYNNQIMALQAELQKEKNRTDQLSFENRQLVAEKNQLVAEKNQLVAEKNQLVAEKNQLVAEKNQLNEQIQELQNREAATLTTPQQSNIIINQQIDDDETAPAELNERFRSLVYSNIAELFIENRVQSIQNYVYGTSATSSCNVTIDVNFGFEDFED